MIPLDLDGISEILTECLVDITEGIGDCPADGFDTVRGPIQNPGAPEASWINPAAAPDELGIRFEYDGYSDVGPGDYTTFAETAAADGNTPGAEDQPTAEDLLEQAQEDRTKAQELTDQAKEDRAKAKKFQERAEQRKEKAQNFEEKAQKVEDKAERLRNKAQRLEENQGQQRAEQRKEKAQKLKDIADEIEAKAARADAKIETLEIKSQELNGAAQEAETAAELFVEQAGNVEAEAERLEGLAEDERFEGLVERLEEAEAERLEAKRLQIRAEDERLEGLADNVDHYIERLEDFAEDERREGPHRRLQTMERLLREIQLS